MELLIIAHEIQEYGNQGFNSILNYVKGFNGNNEFKITVITSSNGKHQEQDLGSVQIIYIDIGKKDNLPLTNKEIINFNFKATNLAYKIIEAKLLLNKKSFDGVHCFGGLPSGYIGYKINKKYNIPYIINLLGPDIPFYKKKFEYIDKLLFTKLSKIIWDKSQGLFCESNWLLDLAKMTGSSTEIQLIYPGLINQEIKTPKDQKNFNILFIGKINESIPFINFLRGFRKFSKNKENVNLNMFAYGGKTKEIEEYIKQKVLYKKINLQSFSPELNFTKIYEKNNIFAIPYSQEYVNKNILEAISYGHPLLIDKQSSGIELIDENSIIIDSCNYLDIANKLQIAYDNFTNLQLNKKPYNNLQTYDFQIMLNSYEKIYKMMITK
ncbi:MAG: glycosyltransferase [Candidatus Absconditabacteria bacterium]